MSVITVGAGEEFATIAGAVASAHDGDVVQVQAGTYTNDFATVNAKITIEGVGGMVHLLATESPPNGKAILTTNTDATLENLDISGAQVSDQNGAAVRYQGGNLTVLDCYFHDNQEGILGGPIVDGTGTITIRSSEFAFNGAGDGYSHNIYVGDVASLVIDQSYVHDALGGHEIKSRAEQTTITNSRIQDGPNGNASYSIDLPNGGAGTISNNVIEQGPNSQNPAMIAFGEEGNLYANSSLTVSGNTVLNDLDSRSASLVLNPTSIAVSITGNSVYGLPASQILNGPGTVSATTMLGIEPALVTTSPWSATPAPTPITAPSPAPDTLVLQMAEDAWQGDAQFTVSVNGAQLGGVQTVTASHAAGQSQTFSFSGAFGGGPDIVSVDFLNDAWGGSAATDRNLYVNAISVDGTNDPTGSGALYSTGTANFAVPSASAPAAPAPSAPSPVATQSGSLVLNMAEDAWQGDAQFTVSVDGTQLGGVQTATASHAQGQSQAFTFDGNFAAGQHTVAVDFLNDAYGGNAQTDRNLYVDSIDMNGTANPQATGPLYASGTVNFAVSAGVAAAQASDTLVLHLSEDAYKGDAQFIVSVDGTTLGAPQSVTASHALGQTQDFSFTGVFGVGPHDIAVSFLNDAWGGSPSTDRNLYVNSMDLDGTHYAAASATLGTTGTTHFEIGGSGTL